MTTSRGLRVSLIFMVLALTVGCDQTSKHFARTELARRGPLASPGGFVELTLAENSGAFLSLGESMPEQLRTGVLVILVGLGLLGLSGYLMTSASLGWVGFLSLTLVWAGGMSNLVDRLARQGLVTDFILI